MKKPEHYEIFTSMAKNYSALMKNPKYYKDEVLLYDFMNDFYQLLYDNIHNTLAPVKDKGDNEKYIRYYCKYIITNILKVCKRKIELFKKQYEDSEEQDTQAELFLEKWEELEDNYYALASFRSLKHYAYYIERGNTKKVWEKTMNIFEGFFYYANQMVLGDKIDLIRASYFPGAGKTYGCNLICTFWYGYNPQMTILRITYSDDLCKSFTNQISNILKTKEHKKVFPYFNKETRDLFEEDSAYNIWFKNTPNTNFMATTRAGQSTGKRADLIIVDDILKGSIEAYNVDLQNQIVNTYDTDWTTRGDNDKQKMILAGTMWSRFDLLNVVQQRDEQEGLLKPDTTFKYIEKNTDGSKIYIGVPALDYETDESTCPLRYSTEYFRKKRKDMVDKSMFSAVYQQRPEPPEDVLFDYKKLETYNESTFPQEILNGEFECRAMVDPNRKGTDYFACAFFKRRFYYDDGKLNYSKWYLTDVVCRQKPYKLLKEVLIEKIIKNKVSRIAVEINTSNELGDLIKSDLMEKGYNDINVDEVYSTETKEFKIQNAQQEIVTDIIYPQKGMFDVKSEMGIAMQMLTSYSINQSAKDHDDFPDCVAMFTIENCGDKTSNSVAVLNVRI